MDNLEKDFSYTLYSIFNSNKIEDLFNNIKTRIEKYELNNKLILSTVTDEVYENNCYAVSSNGMIINYSKVELHKIKNPVLIFLMRVAINLFSSFLSHFKIDKMQTLNNFMLSTNFFSDYWKNIDVQALTRMAIKKHPDHALSIRSINNAQNKEILTNLLKNGWIRIVTRQVYIFPSFNLKRRDSVRDLELLKSEKYIFTAPDINNLEHFKIAESLYNELYLQKYTQENIQYTALYMQKLCKENLLHLRLLLDTEQNKFVAVTGLIGDNITVTAPIVGYEIERPSKDALYRRCLIYIIKYAHDNNLFLNISSGAPSFKLNRGAVPEIEYMLINTQHLSLGRRILWSVLSLISLYIYKPILQKYKL